MDMNIEMKNMISDDKLQQVFEMLKKDQILCDVNETSNISELDRLICYEKGIAMKLKVIRFDKKEYNVIIRNDGTLLDLKKAIEDCVTSKMDYKIEKKRIHCVGLFDDKSLLINYGIHDGSVLHFGYKPIIKKVKDVTMKKYKKKRIFNF